jgi:hypothetical protein
MRDNFFGLAIALSFIVDFGGLFCGRRSVIVRIL